MEKYRRTFTDKELEDALRSNDKRAEEILKDEVKWNEFKNSVENFLDKARKIPVLGSVIDDIVTMVQLADAYVHKEYTAIPWTSVVAIVAALIYLLSPIDLVPDFIPVVGYLDDVAVVMFVLKLGVGHDLEDFQKWKENNRTTSENQLVAMMADEVVAIVGDDKLATLLLSDDNMLRILCATESGDLPLACKVIMLKMPVGLLGELNINSECQYLDFLNKVLNSEKIQWSTAGKKEAIRSDDFEEYEDCFTIVGGDDDE